MALWQASQLLYPGPIAAFHDVSFASTTAVLFGDFVVPAALAVGDLVEMVCLPTNYVPVDLVAAFEAVGTTATVDIGMLSGNCGALLDATLAARLMAGNEFIAAANVAAPGIVRPTKKDYALLAPVAPDASLTPPNVVQITGDRGVGFKVLAGLAGLVTGAKVRFTLTARPRINGV